MSKPQPQSDGAVCRELWAAIEARPPLRVGSVIVSDRRYRWACLVVVPWSRYAIEVDCREELAELLEKLAAFEAGGLAASVADNVGGRSTEPRTELCEICLKRVTDWVDPGDGKRVCIPCDEKFYPLSIEPDAELLTIATEPLEVNAFTSKAKPKRKAAGADNVGGQLELGLF